MARGGKRTGAGRPACSAARRERVWARIRPELLDEIERIAAHQAKSPGALLARFIETGMMVWAEDRSQMISLLFEEASA